MLLEFSMFPLAKEESLSPYVARILDIIDRSGLDYQLHAMGTVIEGELGQLLDVLQRCFEAMQADCDRISCTAKFDYRKGRTQQLSAKVQSVQQQVGRKLRTVPDSAAS